MGAECKSHIMEKDAAQSDVDKAESHFMNMDSRSDWDVLHKKASDKWARRFGIHAPTLHSWGDSVDWLRKKHFKVAQIMLMPPNEYFPKEHRELELKSSLFKSIVEQGGVDFIVHSPYVIQVAGQDKGRKVSAKSLKVQCRLSGEIGFKRVVVHASSPKATSLYASDSIAEVTGCWRTAIAEANAEAPGVTVLIENPAWKATHFSEPQALADMIRGLRQKGLKVGMCYDSAHHWAAVPAYDAFDLKSIADVVELVHYNDCPVDQMGGKDRHSYTPMGAGKMGAERLKKVLEAFPGVDCILERASWFDMDLEYIAKL